MPRVAALSALISCWMACAAPTHFDPPNRTHAHSPSSICIVTMANDFARERYSLALRSQECYARRHGYTYHQESLRAGLSSPSLQKPLAIKRWVENEICSWVAWFDADLFVVQQTRPLDEWLYRNASMVIKDDHTMMNNAAFMLRARTNAQNHRTLSAHPQQPRADRCGRSPICSQEPPSGSRPSSCRYGSARPPQAFGHGRTTAR